MIERKANVAIIEDSKIHAEWLSALLTENENINITNVSYSGKSGIDAAIRLLPDLILLDFQLPDISGLEVATRIKAKNENIKIFSITSLNEISIIERLIDDKHIDAIGIKGSPYLEDNLVPAIFNIIEGKSYIDPSFLNKMRTLNQYECLRLLTKREFEVFMQVSIGRTDDQISSDLCVDTGHVRNIKSKISKKIKGNNIRTLTHMLVENMNCEAF